jgi:Zn-dependent peptidase ImmA (M78 family)
MEVLMERVAVPPELLRWARKRSSATREQLISKWPRYVDWETGKSAPTMRQLEELAHKSHLPLGFFFLPWAPSEDLEIADYRPSNGRPPPPPSPELLEVVHLCRLRQQWYREQALLRRGKPLKFVGSKKITHSVVEVADSIRATLDLTPRGCADPDDATDVLDHLISQAEGAGILVMRGGGSVATALPGEYEPEFRGIALSDSHAPLVYLDASDTIPSQIFTFMHELAHLWLGRSGVSNPHETLVANAAVSESFCNRVAAEALVPLGHFKDSWNGGANLDAECTRLAAHFCVSNLIILRRAYDAGFIEAETFHDSFQAAAVRAHLTAHIRGVAAQPFSPAHRIGRLFAEALATAVQAHRLDEHEAMGLLAAAHPEEVWCVCGSHDDCLEKSENAPAYARLAAA